jgi:hypothetical protein
MNSIDLKNQRAKGIEHSARSKTRCGVRVASCGVRNGIGQSALTAEGRVPSA